MIKYCSGCGIKLQTINKNEEGYIPENKYIESLYCQRCFRMTHYGDLSKDNTLYNELDLINKINEKNNFTLFLVDFLCISNEVINLFRKINTPKCLIVNKCEILPKFLKREKLKEYLKDNYNIDEVIIKGNKNREASIILNYLNKNNVRYANLVGLSNSGKSTLINDLLDLKMSNTPRLTVNKKENTTLDFITIKVDDSLTLIDTPGFIKPTINIKKGKKIRSFIFQMKENETLNLTEDLYINFSNDCNINFFTDYNNERVIKKNYKSLDYIYELDIDPSTDLVILGLGFISFKSGTRIKTNISKEYLSLRKSIFGGQDE